MENVELSIKTKYGEVNLKFNQEEEDLTWMEIARYFTQGLKALGYYPEDLEDFLSKLEQKNLYSSEDKCSIA